MEVEAVVCIAACEIVNFWYGTMCGIVECALVDLMSDLGMNIEFVGQSLE